VQRLSANLLALARRRQLRKELMTLAVAVLKTWNRPAAVSSAKTLLDSYRQTQTLELRHSKFYM